LSAVGTHSDFRVELPQQVDSREFKAFRRVTSAPARTAYCARRTSIKISLRRRNQGIIGGL
jgi:hypothetical protein